MIQNDQRNEAVILSHVYWVPRKVLAAEQETGRMKVGVRMPRRGNDPGGRSARAHMPTLDTSELCGRVGSEGSGSSTGIHSCNSTMGSSYISVLRFRGSSRVNGNTSKK